LKIKKKPNAVGSRCASYYKEVNMTYYTKPDKYTDKSLSSIPVLDKRCYTVSLIKIAKQAK